MDILDFSEEEIQEQLLALGYKNVPKHRLCEFKQDLDELVRGGEWKSFASSAGMNGAASGPSPPAFTKEKVAPCYFENSGQGFFLHAGNVQHERQVISCRSRCDSYARHSVALNHGPPHGPPQGPPHGPPHGPPGRLQVEEQEPDPGESLHPALTDSYASTPDSHRGRYIKRKVLRKHEGQSLVCDESVYSEEDTHVGNMHKVHRPPEDHEQNSLCSSFWSDGDGREEEEEETEQVVGEEHCEPVSRSEDSHQEQQKEDESKPFGDDSLQETSDEKDSESFSYSEDSLQEEEEEEEEESTPVGEAGDSLQDESEEEDDSNLLSGSEDSHHEEQEEEEEERVIAEEESAPAAGEEDSPQEEEEEDSRPLREEKPEVNPEVVVSTEGLEGGHDDDDDEECCSRRSDSLMTSGYGTFQPEELDGGDDRDVAGFDHDSRRDPSETGGDEEEEDDCSLGWFDLGPSETRCPRREVDAAGPGGDKGPCARSETGEQVCPAEDKVDVKNCEGGSGDEEAKRREERDTEDEAESSSNKDIKFIDSKMDPGHSERDGNLRQKTSKRLK